MDQANPEFPKTPPECEITGSVSLELQTESVPDGYVRSGSETVGYVRPEPETEGYIRPESVADGYVRPESETDGYIRTESATDGYIRHESATDEYLRPESATDGYVLPEQIEQTSAYINTGEKKESNKAGSFDDVSIDCLQRQNTKKDILLRLNRKMSTDLSFTEDEGTLTFDDSSQTTNDTLEIQSPKIPNEPTGETLGCVVSDANMTENRPHLHSDRSEGEGPKVLPDDSVITYNKKEYKRSGIPIKFIPKTTERLEEKVNLRKSKLSTKVIQMKSKICEKIIKKSQIPTRVIQVKSKAAENSYKKSDWKKFKIPTRVIQVKSKAAENSHKKSDSNISKIPTRVIQVRSKVAENSPTKSESKKSKLPTRITGAMCKAVEKSSAKSDWKKSNVQTNRSSPLAEMVLSDIDLDDFKIPIKIPNPEILMDTSRLPVVVKDSESSVTVATPVEVKVSRLPQKLRSFFHKLKRRNATKLDKKCAKGKKVRFSLPIDDIYREALSGKDRMKSRLPMPIRVTHPGKLNPRPSQIPLAFSRFPNPAKIRKITLMRRVKKALTKQVAKINWKPKLNFPNLELFFQNIRGNNKVMPINA